MLTTSTSKPGRNRRPTRAGAVLATALLMLVAGCADLNRSTGTPVALPGGGTVPASVASTDQVWVALSTATPDLTVRFLDQLGEVVVPEAIARAHSGDRPVTVEVYATDEATAGHADQLASVVFPRMSGDTNQLVGDREAADATNQLFTRLKVALAARPTAPAEDVVGTLTLLADDAGQVPDAAHHILGVVLGDGLSSTNTCTTTLLPAGNQQEVDSAAQECLAGSHLDLAGVPIWLDGIGLDPTGGQLTPTQLDHARQILVRIVEQAGGHICRAGPVLVPDPAHC